MIDEKKLVVQILEGNEKSLRKFFRHFQPRLFTFISNKIADQNDAEEILQDTLLATLEGLRDFAFRSSLFTFICSIASHKVIDFYRKKKVKRIAFSKFLETDCRNFLLLSCACFIILPLLPRIESMWSEISLRISSALI